MKFTVKQIWSQLQRDFVLLTVIRSILYSKAALPNLQVKTASQECVKGTMLNVGSGVKVMVDELLQRI